MALNSTRLSATVGRRVRKSGLSSRQIADLIGSKDTTSARRWLTGENDPSGELRIRLWHLLAELGMKSPELNKLQQEHPFGYYLGRLLALGVIDVKEMTAITGLKHTQQSYDILQGETAHHPTETVESLTAKYDSTLNSKIVKLHENNSLELSSSIEQASKPTDQVSKDTTETAVVSVEPATPDTSTAWSLGETTTKDREAFLFDIARKLADVAVLMRILLNTCSAEERAQVRAHLGENGMFDLSQLVNRMCGERANQLGKASN